MEHVFDLPDEQATAELAREMSLFLSPGDLLTLSGELGTGKTTFARALIRCLKGNPKLEVPSPSFTLIQTYETPRTPVAHVDLYRLKDASELAELGLEELLQDYLVLMEWPEKAEGYLPHDRLCLAFDDRQERCAAFSGSGRSADKAGRLIVAHDFLEDRGISINQRSFLQGDASTRRYERIASADGPVILMDMPDRSDGPPIDGHFSYSDLAHLATGIAAVAAISKTLREKGISAPDILAVDYKAGLALIEDFGDQVFSELAVRNTMISEEMMTAVSLLGDMANMDWPDRVEVEPGRFHHIGRYDDDVLQVEAGLLLDWFWPAIQGTPPDQSVAGSYRSCWQGLFAKVEIDHPVWVLRDFHSPNLIWLPQRQGTARIGVIDTQDCLLGHPAYDLVSLLQDARIDVPGDVHDEQLDFYCAYRGADDDHFDAAAFRTAYAILGAQRACKILGIFTRLAHRDGKPQYLKNIPRVARALNRNLKHPELAALKNWFDTHLPENKWEL